ncbi:MAG: adenosylcobinamide-phosphate synthase CbiB [Gammaproteobacteria bacterium]|nr:adenosylcobinamide-phosphate synthase CbiB [Gammaproteobacteria bacterium]
MIETALILTLALLLDQILGEPRRFHPLVGFGRCVSWFEKSCNNGIFLRIKGAVALFILVATVLIAMNYIQQWLSASWLVELIVLYLALGRKSLLQHARAIEKPLHDSDIATARNNLSYIVSRDTENLNQQGIITATIESVIENSNDAIFAAIFWYLIAGVPGVLCYRLVNTLDAMWGYKNTRYLEFGWAAARLDDLMNWLPARLTVLTFAICGQFKRVISTAFAQGRLCSSPNAGPVMAAGAACLAIRLGGEAYYQQKLIAKPVLGYGNMPVLNDISRAIGLVNKSLLIWLVMITLITLISEFA